MTAIEYGQTLNPKVGESAARRKLEQMVKEGTMRKGIKTYQTFWGNSQRTVKQSDYTEVVK
jgi:hypothetical protein